VLVKPRKKQDVFVKWLSPTDKRLWLKNTWIGLAGLVLLIISHFVGGAVRWGILIAGLALLVLAISIEVMLVLRGRGARRSRQF